jgi:CDP-glucose 4,6-dehydratase
MVDPDFWMRRRVLVTGHTGFKGAWLCLWLQQLGAQVSGMARGTAAGSGGGQRVGGPTLYELAAVGEHMREFQADVRDAAQVSRQLRQARPEIVLHLAAQPLVGRSLSDPALTFQANVMGVANVLEAVRQVGSDVRAVVVVGSDKSYVGGGRADGRTRPFVEEDPLGGDDPYSSSKACAELVVSAYRRSFFADADAPRVATARTGNVIGGGDWGPDRLVADAVRAVEQGRTLEARHPNAVRRWQHVLNPLEGYLMLAEALWRDSAAARAWNFGPPADDARSVSWIVARLSELWDGELRWRSEASRAVPETHVAALDCSAAGQELRWRPRLRLEQALELVVQWHRAQRAGEDVRELSLAQIARFA